MNALGKKSFDSLIDSLHNYSKTKALAIVLLITTFLISFKIISANPLTMDSYLHMGLGKYIVEQGSLPKHQDISFKETEPSFELIPHSWLSDVIFYITGSQNTLSSATLLLVIFLISSYLIYEVLSLLKIPTYLKLSSLSIIFLIAPIFWKLHPLVFATPLMLGFIYIYLLWKSKNQKFILLTPLLMILWANLTGGTIIIPISVVVVLTGYEILLFFFKKTKPSSKLILLLLAYSVSIPASVINPLGIRILEYIPVTLSLVGTAQINSTLLQVLDLTNQSYVKNPPTTHLFVLFLLYLLLTTILFLLVTARKRAKFINSSFLVIPLFLVFVLPFNWVRLIPLSVFVTIPILASVLSFIDSNYKKYPIIPVLMLSVLTVLSLLIIFSPPEEVKFEPPKKQIEFILKNGLSGNYLTTWDITGYSFFSLYPERAVLDAQDDLVDEYDLIETYNIPELIPEKALKDIISQNNINTILTNRDIGSLAINISTYPDWSLVYLDYSGYLFVKNDSVTESFLQRNALKHINLSRNLGFNPEEATKAAEELERFTTAHPESKLAVGQLSTIYRITGNLEKAELALKKVPIKDWDFTLYTEMGRIKAAQGDCTESEKNFIKVFEEKSEQNFSRAVLDLAVVYAGCFGDKEKAKHYFQRYNSFIIPPSEHARVRKIAETFGIDLDE